MRKDREYTSCADAVSEIAEGIAKVIEGGLRIPAEILDDVCDRGRDRRWGKERRCDFEGGSGAEIHEDTIDLKLDDVLDSVNSIRESLRSMAGEIQSAQSGRRAEGTRTTEQAR